MSVAAAPLRASPGRKGAPIRIVWTYTADLAGDAAAAETGIGITTSSTTPAAVGDFAHTLGDLPNGRADTRQKQTFDSSGDAATLFKYTREQGQAAIDSNFVVGRYVWAFARMSDDTLHLSSSYHIH